MLFEQVVGDGANLFINIVAIIIGFVGAMAYQDAVKIRKEQEGKEDH